MYEKYKDLTLEEFLRQKMVDDFGSVRKFSMVAEIPYTTLATALKSGISSDMRAGTLDKLFNTLGVSSSVIDFWPPLEDDKNTELNDKDKKEISKILDNTREQLTSQEGLMFDGEPASEEGVQSILDALELGLEIAKKRNKEKYTPKKYRK